jgi:carboxymethylenebutenolidase
MRLLRSLALALLACSCAQDDAPESAADPGAPAATAAPAVPEAPSIAAIPPAVEVTAYEIAYGDAAVLTHNGYFVLPTEVGEVLPGIILIHDQWGLNNTIRAMARRLSGEGYAVLAIDLFSGKTGASAAEGDELVSEFLGDRVAVLENISHARTWLQENGLPPRIGTVGFGFGGEWALDAGLEFGDGIDAIVMFYGRVNRGSEELETLSAPLLGIFAAQDSTIPVRGITQFRSSLRDLGKDSLILIHSNVGHDFANPDSGAYNHDAAAENWATTLEFLGRTLRSEDQLAGE